MTSVQELYDQYVMTSFLKRIEPVVVERAKGATVIAEDGRKYLDCFAGIAVVNAGHCHEKVVNAAIEQAKKLVHCCSYVYYVRPVAELARRLSDLAPGGPRKTFFSNSGAEANEGALKLAKKYTKRPEVVALTYSFHGRTYATLSVTGNYARKKGAGPYMPGVAFAPAPYCYRCPLSLSYPSCDVSCASALEGVIELQTSSDVACFIAEPVLGEAGIIVPPEDYFRKVKSVLDKRQILFICDEVQSGFGRTGKMFAIEHYGVDPDIITMAKGIADGFPLGAFSAKPEIADAFEPGDHLSTFGGNPVSCAAALANIEVLLGEGIVDNARVIGDFMLDELKQLAKRYSVIGDVRGKGLMIGVELVKDDKKTPAPQEAARVRQACLERGVLVGLGGFFGSVLRIQPPLVLTRDEASFALEALEASVKGL